MIDGNAVKAARLRAGFKTQQELADSIGCARNTINRAELGRGGPAILQRIAAKLGVTVESLMVPTTAPGQITPSGEEQMLIRSLRKLDPVMRAKALGYIMGLAEGGGADESAALGADLLKSLTQAQHEQQNRDSVRSNSQ